MYINWNIEPLQNLAGIKIIMNEKERYEIDKIQKVAEGLADLPQTERVVKVNKTQTVKLLLNDIKSAQAKGYTVEQISEHLKQQGFNISVTLIRNALAKLKTTRHRSKVKQNNNIIDGKSNTVQVKINEQPVNPASLATASRDTGVKVESAPRRQLHENERATGGRFIPKPDIEDI